MTIIMNKTPTKIKTFDVSGNDAAEIFAALYNYENNQEDMNVDEVQPLLIEERIWQQKHQQSDGRTLAFPTVKRMKQDKNNKEKEMGITLQGCWIGDHFCLTSVEINIETYEKSRGEGAAEEVMEKYKPLIFNQQKDCQGFLKLYRQDFYKASRFFGLFSKSRMRPLIKSGFCRTMKDVEAFAKQNPNSRTAKVLKK